MKSEEKARLFYTGLNAFNAAHFYDAHEHWEEVWLEISNPDKIFLQGLIQIAAAYHHYSRSNRPGTKNLLQAGLLKLDCFPNQHWGIEIEPLRMAVRQWLSALTAGENPSYERFPKIHFRISG